MLIKVVQAPQERAEPQPVGAAAGAGEAAAAVRQHQAVRVQGAAAGQQGQGAAEPQGRLDQADHPHRGHLLQGRRAYTQHSGSTQEKCVKEYLEL